MTIKNKRKKLYKLRKKNPIVWFNSKDIEYFRKLKEGWEEQLLFSYRTQVYKSTNTAELTNQITATAVSTIWKKD